MDLGEFTDVLGRMTATDIHRVAAALEQQRGTAAGDVDWWEATIAIERALKIAHRTRAAAAVACGASRAVQHAAVLCGVELPDNGVTAVARAAAEVARGLAAGPGLENSVSVLLASWDSLLAPAA
jgi:hypothetical protein